MYSDEEIEEAVGKIVRTSIRRQFGSLGNRRTDLTFNDTKDAAAGVFILFPNALFYVVYLAAQRLQSDVEEVRAAASSLAAAILASDRKVTPVDNISSLANAREGLLAMQTAVQSRLTAFQNVASVPAYQRFEKNAKRFLDEVGAKLKANGAIVLTPDEARAKITKLFNELKAGFEALKKSATFMGTAVEDFERLNLPGLLSNTVISNAQKVLGERFAELEALTPEQRLLILRGVVLDVLAARSAVKGFGKLSTSTTFLEIAGTGSVYADDEYPSLPATIYAENVGPYGILPFLDGVGNGSEYLEFTVDNDWQTTVNLLGSYVASIEGGLKGIFHLGSPNDIGAEVYKFSVGLRHWPQYGDDILFDVDFSLAVGAVNLHAWDISYYANLQIDAYGPGLGIPAVITFEPYCNPLKLVRSFNLTVDTIVLVSLISVVAVDHTTLGLKVGDHFIINDPSSTNVGRQFKINSITALKIVGEVLSNVVHVDGTDDTNITIEFTDGALAVRVKVAGSATWDGRSDSLFNHQTIYFPAATGGDEALQQSTLNGLGFVSLMESKSQATRTKDLVKQFNATSATALNGVARIEADFEFVPSTYVGNARTDPNDFSRLVCSRLYDRARALTVISGNDVSFSTILGEEAEVQVGHTVVIRSHSDTDSIGVMGLVTAVTNNAVLATLESPVTADTVDFECGPTFAPREGQLVFITGSINEGEYEVAYRDTVPFEFQLTSPFPYPSARGNQPVFFVAGIGNHRAIFKSTAVGLTSALRYDHIGNASAVLQFTPEDSQEAVGQTSYFQLPEMPAGIEEDDVLELYTTQFNMPSYTGGIRSFDFNKRVIELSVPLPISTPSFVFTKDTPIPFARVRKKRRANYDQLRRDLAAWLTRFDSQDRYFSEINRSLNGVVTNKNPTIIQTNDARARVLALDNNLNQLVAGLVAYTADIVPEVDVLVQSFKEKGADRAVALLLEARVNEFFSLTQEEASYAGSLQKAIRAVEKNDLPVKKTGRDGVNRAASSTLASYDEVDFEFDQSDIDPVGEPDSLGFQGPAQPGNAY